MLKLNFNLRHQDIRLVNKGAVVATDSKNYLVANFNFISDDWETPLTAIFTDDKHKQPYAVIVGTNDELAGNECFVPWEVLTDECNVYVSVYCGNLHTTVTAAFKVRKSGYTDGETPPPPSPTVYDIILQAINDLRTNKQDKLTAGENITIEDNVISATGDGSQIVSGVVNANGTITFTDSDGNSFTTSGESVIGADGFSPVATVTQTASGATVSITDLTGTTTANISNGQDGNDYVLTAQDKSDIADIVLGELPTTEGVLYGNQSN